MIGSLSLTSLFLEGEKDLTTFKSICDLCPCLKKLEILETSITGPSEKQAGNLSQITLPEIQADFNKLSQVCLNYYYLFIFFFKLSTYRIWLAISHPFSFILF